MHHTRDQVSKSARDAIKSREGNILDSRSVETLLTDLRHAGVPNVALLTGRGYESIQNLEQYILSGQKMVMCLKVGQL